MSTTPPKPLNMTKHALLIAGLAAFGEFISSLVFQGVISQGLGAAIGAGIGELVIYEHSA